MNICNVLWSALYVYSMNPSLYCTLYTVQCTVQAGHGRGRFLGKDDICDIELWPSTWIIYHWWLLMQLYILWNIFLKFFWHNYFLRKRAENQYKLVSFWMDPELTITSDVFNPYNGNMKYSNITYRVLWNFIFLWVDFSRILIRS